MVAAQSGLADSEADLQRTDQARAAVESSDPSDATLDLGPDAPFEPSEPAPPSPIGSAAGGSAMAADEKIDDVTTEPTATAPRAPAPADLEHRDAAVRQLADRVAALESAVVDQARAISDVHAGIATAVDQATTDDLLSARHASQLAAESMARLSLALSDASAAVTGDLPAETANALLSSFQADVEAVLAQLGYIPIGARAGDAFDPRRHRGLTRTATTDEALDRRIGRVIRDGYQAQSTGRVLLFSDVEVHRFHVPT